MKRIILLIVLILAAAAAWIGYKEYNRTNKDLQRAKPDVTISAASLLQAFEKDTTAANKQYVDKIVEVSGTVKGIDADGNPVVISLGNAGEMSSVQCSMDSVHVADYKAVKEGNAVTIKGKCTGGQTQDLFGTDVILSRCVLVTKP